MSMLKTTAVKNGEKSTAVTTTKRIFVVLRLCTVQFLTIFVFDIVLTLDTLFRRL